MTKKEKFSAPNDGWHMWLDKSSQALKKAWKFANEFNLLDKMKKIKVPTALKVSGLALLLSSKSLNTNAAQLNSKDAKTNKTELRTQNKTPKNNAKTVAYEAAFRAYPGKYYNEICNGSPCWLASTYETNGAGIGKKPSSIATWNDNGNYRGLNQISPDHARKFLDWLKTESQYQSVYAALKKGGVGKANWQKTARNQEHLMTEAFEWYMVKEYNSDNFKTIQSLLNKENVNISLKKLHPAVLSLMHQIMVELPSRRQAIANKIIKFHKENGGNEEKLNSEAFIKKLTANKTIQKRAVNLLNDSSIQWKTAQFDSLLAKVKPENNDEKTWFQIQKEKQNQLAKKNSSKTSSQEDKNSGHLQTHILKNFNSPEIQKELSLARRELSTKKASKDTSAHSPVYRQTLIDDRLLKSKKNSGRA